MSSKDLEWAFRGDGRRRRARPAPLPLTSMMDMLTIILIFLLLNLRQDYAANKVAQHLDLPTAVPGAEPIGAHRISISRTQLELDDVPMGQVIDGQITDDVLGVFREVLLDSFDEEQGPAPVVLLADQSLPYETVDRVVRAAGEAGFPDFNFAVVKEGG